MADHGSGGPGLHLTEHQRMHIANRLMLQLPDGLTEAQIIAHRRFLEQTFNGIPGDVLFTLDAIRLLADQGNKIAADLFDEESEKLGLTRKSFFGPEGRR